MASNSPCLNLIASCKKLDSLFKSSSYVFQLFTYLEGIFVEVQSKW
jgi:hypothetical protein